MTRTKLTWEWLAGFTDGDGCISILPATDRRDTVVRISWAQKESESQVLDLVAKFIANELGENSKRLNRSSVAYQGHRYPQAGLYYGAMQEVEAILRNLVPHLVIKRDRAAEALAEFERKAKLRKKKGWLSQPASNKKKTHCVRGHPLSGDNLYLTTRGRRECRKCRAARSEQHQKQLAGR